MVVSADPRVKTMRAARMHKYGDPFVIDTIPKPSPGPSDVLVAVRACGIVPNLHNIIANWNTWFPHLPTPPLPAIYGLDPAGVIEEVGANVMAFKPGDRVYVNPGRSCGSCRRCRSGDRMSCRNFTFNGYFGFGPESGKIFAQYPYGGFAEFLTAPEYALVPLPENVGFEHGARLGYIGTAYSAMRKLGVDSSDSILINGISGTLGLGAALIALALGVPKILGTGRNQALLDRVKQLAPNRIDVLSVGGTRVQDWAKACTDGVGVDAVMDTMSPGSPATSMLDASRAVRRGGRFVNIGGMAEPFPLDMHWLMDENIQFFGSLWFSAGEGEEMANMASAGTLDLSVFENRRYPLERVNEAIADMDNRSGGFTNTVVCP